MRLDLRTNDKPKATLHVSDGTGGRDGTFKVQDCDSFYCLTFSEENGEVVVYLNKTDTRKLVEELTQEEKCPTCGRTPNHEG